MRLADYLLHFDTAILQGWDAHARAHAPAAAANDAASLRQGAPQILAALAAALAARAERGEDGDDDDVGDGVDGDVGDGVGGVGGIGGIGGVNGVAGHHVDNGVAGARADGVCMGAGVEVGHIGVANAALFALSEMAAMSAPPARTAATRRHQMAAADDLPDATARRGRAADRVAASAAAHGAARLRSGYALTQLVDELAALRASVLRRWCARAGGARVGHARDIARFNALFELAMAAAVAHYTRALPHSEARFEQALMARLQAPLARALAAQRVLASAGASVLARAQAQARIGDCKAQLRALLDDLRDFAGVRRDGALPITPGRADLGEICAATLARLRLIHPRRALRCRGSGALDGWWDAPRLGQALATLIDAALGEAGAFAPLTLNLEGRADDCVITITQRGAASAAEVLARYALAPGAGWHGGAADSAEQQRAAALGNSIGMVIARAIVAAHSGSISVAARSPAGTCVTLRLPRDAQRAG